MLNNIREEFNRVKKGFRIISLFFVYVLNLLLLGYYVFALITDMGDKTVNVILLCITVALLLLSAFYDFKAQNKENKAMIKGAKHTVSVF